MSSNKKNDFIEVKKEEFTSQITGNDISGCLKNYLTKEYRDLRKTYNSRMNNWIVSRSSKVENFHGFVMLCLH